MEHEPMLLPNKLGWEFERKDNNKQASSINTLAFIVWCYRSPDYYATRCIQP